MFKKIKFRKNSPEVLQNDPKYIFEGTKTILLFLDRFRTEIYLFYHILVKKYRFLVDFPNF